MKDIFYKGYRLYCEKIEDGFIRARVLGRETGRYRGIGITEEDAINKLKKEINKVR